MAWKTKSGDPDIRRNTFPVTVQRSGGNVVTENMIIDQNIKTGNYVVYKKNLVGGEVVVIQSNKDSNDGLYKVTSGPGAQLSPIGIEPKDYEKFILTSLPDISDEQRKNYFQINGPQTAVNLGVPGFRNAANPNPPTGTTQTPYLPSTVVGGGGPQTSSTSTPLNDPKNIPIPTINASGQRTSYGHYFYPTNIRNNKQDFIQFIAYEYVGRGLNVGKSTKDSFDARLGFDPRKFGSGKGSVTLPIQPSITDTNAVQWGGEELNSLQAYAASVSYAAQSDIAGTGERVLKDLDTIFKSGSNSDISNAVRLFLAGKAVGVSGLLSRMGGAVLNPNLELLFQGPQLRPFNFTFRLSPRDEKEAEQVKYIIRYFKQNMSVKNTNFNLFLKAPNVFKIKYHLRGTDKDHPSLNRIKICALQSCSVDYTPDGSYMTFNDESATMTSYNLSLQFQELEPVTEKDYQDLKDETIIGY